MCLRVAINASRDLLVQPGAGLLADLGVDRQHPFDRAPAERRQPQRADPPVGRVRPAIDQPLLVQAIEQPHQRDRLDLEHRRDRRLAQPLVARDVEQRAGLVPGQRQSGVAGAALEAAADQPRDIVQHRADIGLQRRRVGTRRGRRLRRCCAVAGPVSGAMGATSFGGATRVLHQTRPRRVGQRLGQPRAAGASRRGAGSTDRDRDR